jgi:hypothetical protein
MGCAYSRTAMRNAHLERRFHVRGIEPQETPISFDGETVNQNKMDWHMGSNQWNANYKDDMKDMNDPEIIKVIKLCGI